MSWTNPDNHVWTTGEIVTAANMNTYIRLNLDYSTSALGATVASLETTTSTSFTDLSTVGPTVTMSSLGTSAIVIMSALQWNSGNNNSIAGWAATGALVASAIDNRAAFNTSTAPIKSTDVAYINNFSAGSTTFTAKYRVSAGTGSFQYRNLTVIPLP